MSSEPMRNSLSPSIPHRSRESVLYETLDRRAAQIKDLQREVKRLERENDGLRGLLEGQS
jgi:cell shape-determining protein MreC